MIAYDAEGTRRIGQEVCEAIDLAALGEADWNLVAERFGSAFPGAFVAIINQDFTNGDVNFAVDHNLDPDYFRSYCEHYAHVNPWTEVWSRLPAGQVLISEELSPARTFANSEFYNDWLLPQKTVEAASGMKIDGGPRDVVHMTVHYPLTLHGLYDPATAAILRQIRDPLKRAIRFARRLSENASDAAAKGAIVERFDRAAIVVDKHMKIMEANESALESFRAGSVLRAVLGYLSLANASQSTALAKAVREMALGMPVELDEFCFPTADGVWLIHLAPVRVRPQIGLAAILPPAPQVLVLARNLSALKHDSHVRRFAALHCLTPAETLFCERLLAGDGPVMAADKLAIAESTARQRLKAIFHKTGVNRQAELVRAMMSFE